MYSRYHGRQSEPDHFFSSLVRRQPQSCASLIWGGEEDSHTFFPTSKIGGQFSRHRVGVPKCTSPTSLTSKKKGPQRRRAHEKGSSFQWIIIQPQNRGGGGHLILLSPLNPLLMPMISTCLYVSKKSQQTKSSNSHNRSRLESKT